MSVVPVRGKQCSRGVAPTPRLTRCAVGCGAHAAQVAPRTSPSLVYINVSPIEYGHVLLVPRVLDNLQQLVTPDSLALALQFAREAGEQWGAAAGGLAGWLQG